MISIWERDSFYGETDVLIAGGGLMGLWTAHDLLQMRPTLRITIMEALPVPALASTRNAGFACFGSPSELWHDRRTMGEDAMWQVVEQRFKGIQKIRSTFGDAAIGFEPCGGYEVFEAGSDWQGEKLAEKLDSLNRGFQEITGQDAMYTDRTADLGQFGLSGFAAMAGNSIEGALHSGKLVKALVNNLMQAGVVYLAGHRVLWADAEGGRQKALIARSDGMQLEMISGQILWATNAGLSQHPDLKDTVLPARGQVLLSPPIEGLAMHGTFHAEEGFYYFRHYANRLLIGGARHLALEVEQTLEDEPSAPVGDHLRAYIRRHIPQAIQAIGAAGWMHWAGIMGKSAGNKPFVKEIGPGQWAAFACNGMGVALTPVVAGMAARQMIGRSA